MSRADDLVVGQRAVGDAGDEALDRRAIQGAAVPLLTDEINGRRCIARLKDNFSRSGHMDGALLTRGREVEA